MVLIAFKSYTNWDNGEKDWQTWTCNFERRRSVDRRVVDLKLPNIHHTVRTWLRHINVPTRANITVSTGLSNFYSSPPSRVSRVVPKTPISAPITPVVQANIFINDSRSAKLHLKWRSSCRRSCTCLRPLEPRKDTLLSLLKVINSTIPLAFETVSN